MEKGRSRYRISRAEPSAERLKYQRLADRKAAASRQMTYDDYLAQLKDVEKIIEVDEHSFAERFKDAKEATRDKLAGVIETGKKQSSEVLKKVSGTLPSGIVQKGKGIDKRYYIVGASVTSLIVLVLLGQLIFGPNDDPSKTGSVAIGENGEVAGATAPVAVPDEFELVAPKDREDEVREATVYEPQVGIAVYQDTLSGYGITVSQQPLSDEQKADPAESLSEISVSVYASGSLETNKGRAYVVQPSEDDPTQKVMFTMNGLLILMRTNGVSIGDEAWIEYINNIE